MWEGLRLRVLLLCLGAVLWSSAVAARSRGPQDRGHRHHHPSIYRHRERHKEGQVLHRSKRGWVWNQFFVIEEYTGPDPVLVGRVSLDLYSGTIFVIDDKTGNIHATKTLDREEQAEYTLTAQAVARDTNKPLEPPSEFIVKVQDINDNPPVFLHGPYYANVAEMSNVGTSVIQVTASDADDPTYGNSAKLVYSILQGQPYFSIEPHSGIIRTALPNMDREAKQEYDVVIQAKDMGGHMGGLSGTAQVKITLTDVNDNPPKFAQGVYAMSISEDKVPGEEVGRLKARDPDQAENGMVDYNVLEGDGMNFFEISKDSETQEAVVKLKKPVDFETKRSYTLKVEATNSHIDPRFLSWGPFKDTTIVKISVEDADEPPTFMAPSYNFEVEENAPGGTLVGRVHARDTDIANNPIRYLIPRYTDLEEFFTISPEDGMIKTTRQLDRESQAWHNISVSATETGRAFSLFSMVRVNIKVKDVNDNAPEFATQEEVFMCENVSPGTIIKTVSAVDKDEMAHRQHFHFSLAPKVANNLNFSLKDNRDSTANIMVIRRGFSRVVQDIYELPIEINDNGIPPMSSTNTLLIRLCSCDSKGTFLSCNVEHLVLPAGLSTGALIAILACIVILLAIVVLFVALRRQKKEPLIVFEEEDIRENIITYDDEGGGEEDTEAFDIATLQNPDGANGFLPRKDIKPELQCSLRPGMRPVANSVDVDDFIKTRISDADNDPTAPPYDSIQVYGYEGRGSIAGSLSSLESVTTDSDLDYDYLQSWGPRFKRLADLYGTKDSADDNS
uniref:Cadherin 11, type 2, OB-cadherin (osteoblast) n=1 Tax=Astyanax mexicanus TaxID=7994 RepID=W5KPE2_ASTMX